MHGLLAGLAIGVANGHVPIPNSNVWLAAASSQAIQFLREDTQWTNSMTLQHGFDGLLSSSFTLMPACSCRSLLKAVLASK